MKSITPDRCQQELQAVGGPTLVLPLAIMARFRVSIFKQRGNVAMVLRQIPNKLLTHGAAGPARGRRKADHASPRVVPGDRPHRFRQKYLAGQHDQLSSTKRSTTISLRSKTRSSFITTTKRSTINQREVGVDVPSFSEALRRALRQDPDVILVGEMRDLETIEAAITAAETGHVVFGTLHTNSAQGTVNRIIDVFPTNQQEQIRTQFRTSIIGVLAQTLVPKIGGGRVAAYEMLVVTSAIGNLIRENKTFRINSAIQTGAKYGMMLMDDSLFKLWREGKCTKEDVAGQGPIPRRLGTAHRQCRTQASFDDEDDVNRDAPRMIENGPTPVETDKAATKH